MNGTLGISTPAVRLAGRTHLQWKWMLAAAGVALVQSALLTGCAHDARISVASLRRLEAATGKTAPVEVEPQQLELTDQQPYQVSPGDVLALKITGLQSHFEQTELRARVHGDGTISVPLLGEVPVHGLTLAEVESTLRDGYMPKYVKDLTVFAELEHAKETTVVVVGAAGRRGLVTLRDDKRNLLYALASAEAYSPAASGRVTVHPIRASEPAETYDFSSVNDLRRALTAPPLESGDMIVVEPADTSAIYATGLVNVPGAIPTLPGASMSVAQVIAAAGGLVDFLEPPEATLWHRLADGTHVRVKLDLAGILAGKQDDVALQSGDILDVPHTASTRIRQWFAQNIQIGPFGATAVYDPVAERRARTLANNNYSFRRTILDTIPLGIQDTLLQRTIGAVP